MTLRLFIILLAYIVSAYSFASDLQFRRYSTETGMPSNCVRDVVQTPDGFIWLATDGGVVRFDGYHFKSYELVASNSTHDDNFALSLCCHNGVLWVGTDSYLYRYKADTESLSSILSSAAIRRYGLSRYII